jgi:hypothetical protein
MQPFPPMSDLIRFEGDLIAQVRLDPFAVQFAFDSGVTIVAEHCIEQKEPDGTAFLYECVAQSGPPMLLHQLLFRRIVSIKRSELSLTFAFEGGSSLTVFAELDPMRAAKSLDQTTL